MSIRLRLTLLFSIVLALTLGITSTVVYISQSRFTLGIIEADFERFSRGLVAPMDWLNDRDGTFPPESADLDRRTFFEFYKPRDPEMPSSPGRSPYRDNLSLLDAGGNLVDIPLNDESEHFGLSADALTLLKDGTNWQEVVTLDDERFLVFNTPIINQESGELMRIVQLSRSLADRDRAMQSLGLTLGGGTILITLIAFGIGWLFARYTLRPIDRITRSAQMIGETQDFSSRVEYQGPDDELGHLAHTFNDMLANLEESYSQLAHTLQVQQDFVADVSHELRTPLTTIRGNLALMQRMNVIPADERAEILNDLIEESERLSRLTTDLLLLARADAGHRVNVLPVEVNGIINDVCRQNRLFSPERTIICGDTPFIAIANPDVLKQVLLILLDNALKHGQGTVQVLAEQSTDHVKITVCDEGPGMDRELQQRIFDRFYRGDTSRSTPGFGLGLSIAKALIEAQHGTITVSSGPGEGTYFILMLPSA